MIVCCVLDGASEVCTDSDPFLPRVQVGGEDGCHSDEQCAATQSAVGEDLRGTGR